LQSSEPRSNGAGRPSLLTPAQQAEADRNRILTKLEHGRADVGSPAHGRQRMLAWGGAGAVALLLAGGAVFGLSGDKPPATGVATPRLAAASVVPPVAVAAPVAPLPQPDVATILDVPSPGVAAAKPAPGSLLEALEPETASTGGKAQKSPERTAPVVRKPKPPAPRKVVPRAETDSDVALLAALVAHTQAERRAREEQDSCRHLKGRKAKECRAAACEAAPDAAQACPKR
jgi:hypothetical protein